MSEMQNYVNKTLTVNDLNQHKNECGSSFTNCVFDGVDLVKYNFAFALFTKCTWKVKAIGCNFTAAGGDSRPSGNSAVDCNMAETGSSECPNRTTYLALGPLPNP
jgi:uncharacterized protein YjbI with pentapeptide repeats